MKVIWTREALADLADIATYYTTNAGPSIAESVGRRFIDVVERIRSAPCSAPRVTDRSEVRAAAVIRYPFRIFYRVRGDIIHIVHIRHTSRRPLTGLNEPPQPAIADR